MVYLGRKLLKQLNFSPHLIFWYFLNPLVIIELTGNLHFEGVMLFFFLWALYLCHVQKWIWGAVIYGLAISTKLIPLIFLPLFLPYLGWKRSSLFAMMAIGTVGLTTLPFISPDLVDNYSATLSLWFANFEFNASVYNIAEYFVAKAGGKPWEFIKVYGKLVSVVVVVFLLVLTFARKKRSTGQTILMMLYVLTLYYLLTATVHPWYIIFLAVLCLFSNFRFPLFWSALVVLSYAAYSNPDYREEPVYLLIEYSLVFGVLGYEFFKHLRENALNQKNTAQN